MKKSGPIILALLLVLTNLSLFAMPASAANSGDFTYSVISEAKKTCAITGYSGNAAELHIPYKLDGYTVTSINGMDSNDNLKTVWIPNSVTELKAATFWNCQNLECVVVGSGVTSISESSFHECYALKKVVLSGNAANIDKHAFFSASIGSILYGYKNTEAENYYESPYSPFAKFYILPTVSADNAIELYYSLGNTTIEEVCFALYLAFDVTNITVFDRNGNSVQDIQKTTEPGMTFRVSLLNGSTREYSLPDILLGDVNGDGTIDAADAVMIQRYDSGLTTMTDEQLAAADVNADGLVDAADAVKIQRYDAGLIAEL